MSDRDHDRGLAFDLSVMEERRQAAVAQVRTLMDRRGALKMVGGLSLLALAGCRSDGSTTASPGSSGRATTATSATSGGAPATTAAAAGASGASCTAIPQETAGPFPGDGSNGVNVLDKSEVVRSDITSSFGSSTSKAKGVPLTIVLTVQKQAGGCAPSTGAAVYLWHCDIDGRYSLYDRGVTQENYLRGVQAAGGDGTLTFKSIYPGAYSGRWPHIHFSVFESLARATGGGSELRTSQIALPEAASKLVYASPGYERSVSDLARTSLTRDGVFRDGAAAQTPSFSGDVASGITIRLNVPV